MPDDLNDQIQPRYPCPTPCVRHCGIDHTLKCSGCGRTGKQIAAWSSLTEEEKWEIILSLPSPRRVKGIKRV